MVRANPYRPFHPDPAQTAVAPSVSGNTINGLNETTFRRPSTVYWAPDPDDIPHGELQRYFYSRSAENPDFARARAARQTILDAPLPAVADTREPVAGSDLDAFVAQGVCDRTGVAEMQGDWVFAGHTIAHSRVIMLGVAHDYAAIATAPEPSAGLEVMQQYARAAAAAKTVAGWLRDNGWEAEPVTGPMTGALAMIPPALACGFGELGKHGSIINPEHGSSFRLSAVLTDAPLTTTPPVDHGIDAFCANCRICEDACPPLAIAPDKQTVRGVRKWYVDFDRCLPFFNETNGCGICIAVCPWSRPGVGPNLAAKLDRKRNRT